MKSNPSRRWFDWPFYKRCLAFYGLGLPLTFACVSFGIAERTSHAPDWLAVFGPLLWIVRPMLVALIVSNAAVLVIGYLLHSASSRIARAGLLLVLALVWAISGVGWVTVGAVL